VIYCIFFFVFLFYKTYLKDLYIYTEPNGKQTYTIIEQIQKYRPPPQRKQAEVNTRLKQIQLKSTRITIAD
jgi:hypothetical protein